MAYGTITKELQYHNQTNIYAMSLKCSIKLDFEMGTPSVNSSANFCLVLVLEMNLMTRINAVCIYESKSIHLNSLLYLIHTQTVGIIGI